MAIEKKESFRWLEGLQQSRAIGATLPEVQCICVGDSESDIYECIAEPRFVVEAGPAVHDWVIRACYDRSLQDDPEQWQKMRQKMLGAPLLQQATVRVRSRKSKLGSDKRARRQSRGSREAQVEIRAATLTLRPPKRLGRKLPAMTVNVVMVHEPHPPRGVQAIEWMLLTTLPIQTLQEVQRVIDCYCVRWNIELLFRTLKSGCRIEERRFEAIDRILPCLAMCLIAAWRTMFTSRLGRECPDVDCEVLLEPSEWKSVWTAVQRQKPPTKPPTLSTMLYLIAQLGGYIRRPSSEPGVQTLWIGMQRMHDLALAWDAFGPPTHSGPKIV